MYNSANRFSWLATVSPISHPLVVTVCLTFVSLIISLPPTGLCLKYLSIEINIVCSAFSMNLVSEKHVKAHQQQIWLLMSQTPFQMYFLLCRQENVSDRQSALVWFATVFMLDFICLLIPQCSMLGILFCTRVCHLLESLVMKSYLLPKPVMFA